MKKAILTARAPKPIGPYSQAIRHGNFLFISGQVAIDPNSGELNTSSIEDEARQVMKNLSAILQEAGADFSNVVKTTIFLRTMDDFATVNAVYEKYMGPVPPARETVAVAGLPKNANIEISMTAIFD